MVEQAALGNKDKEMKIIRLSRCGVGAYRLKGDVLRTPTAQPTCGQRQDKDGFVACTSYTALMRHAMHYERRACWAAGARVR